MFERYLADTPEYEGIQEFRFGDTSDTVSYKGSVSYEDWMSLVRFCLHEDICGCGRESEKNRTVNLGPYALERYKPDLRYAYIVPEATIKRDTIRGRAYLDFVVNKTDIRPKYRNNEAELAKIIATMDVVKNDTTVTIDDIKIHGFASPEGTWKSNTRLAKGRTAALAKYVADYLNIPATAITTDFTPEDWEGLAMRIPSSKVGHKDEILKLIASDLAPDQKELKIRNQFPEDYDLMLKTIYPALRHSDYYVSYEIHPFDIEEAKRMLRIFPKKLNLNEMYLVSQEYEPGSEQFNRVFEIAVRLYPENTNANLNAANIALSSGDYEKAEQYLKKSGNSPVAVHARGLLALLNGNLEEAEALLLEAGKAGIPEAEHNLAELRTLTAVDSIYMEPDDEGRNPMTTAPIRIDMTILNRAKKDIVKIDTARIDSVKVNISKIDTAKIDTSKVIIPKADTTTINKLQ